MMDAEIIEKLMPLLPFIFMVFYVGVEDIGAKVMFGVFGATTAMFMSFEIAASFNWLSLVYFTMGIGLLLLVLADYTRHMSEVKRK